MPRTLLLALLLSLTLSSAGFAAPTCDVSPTSIDFGSINVGSTAIDSFLVTNSGNGNLSFDVTSPAAPFSVLQGAGSQSLQGGNSLWVVVQYAPTTAGTDLGTVDLGNAICSNVSLTGVAEALIDSCEVSVTTLDFGEVNLFDYTVMSFTIENTGTSLLAGYVSLEIGGPYSCSAWFPFPPPYDGDYFGFDLEGTGSYILNPGEQKTFNIAFWPAVVGEYSCVADLGNPLCPNVDLVAEAIDLPAVQDAKLALHAQSPTTKNRCVGVSQGGPAPDQTPCSQLVTSGSSSAGYDVYVLASGFSTPSPLWSFTDGLSGAELGLSYDGTLGQGVDVFSWEACSDLEFPSATWPEPSGGITLTFNSGSNCQNETISGFESEGGHTILGVMYVYPYGSDVLGLTGRNNIPLPFPKLADCDGSEVELTQSSIGVVGFDMSGCNPCLEDCANALSIPGDSPQGTPIAAFAPNPFLSGTSIQLTLEHQATTHFEIFDLAGRLVRSTAPQSFAAGNHQLTWDGANDQGVSVPAGVYYVRIVAGTNTEMHRVVRLR